MLGTNQVIPLSDLQNVQPPPPGLPTPRPHLRAGLPAIAVVCLCFSIGVSTCIQEYDLDELYAVLLWILDVVLIIVGIVLIVLVWARWARQKRAIRNGIQVIATVARSYLKGNSGNLNSASVTGPTYYLDAEWVGNDGTTYRFRTLTGNTVYHANQPWEGKRVRLYIDRDNPQRYYLDDLPIPEQELSDAVPSAFTPTVVNPPVQPVPSSATPRLTPGQSAYLKRKWSGTWIVLIIVFGLVAVYWIVYMFIFY